MEMKELEILAPDGFPLDTLAHALEVMVGRPVRTQTLPSNVCNLALPPDINANIIFALVGSHARQRNCFVTGNFKSKVQLTIKPNPLSPSELSAQA